MTEFEQIVRVTPAYDKRASDPSKNYGISSCRIVFILKGPLGAVQFMIGTDWYVESCWHHLLSFPHTHQSFERGDYFKPEGWDVGYHSPSPRFEGQEPMDCDLMPGGQCYYDGSGLRADEWVSDFVAGGTDWLWPKLEQEYRELFEDNSQ